MRKEIEKLFYVVKDPLRPEIPLLTSLLHGVCDNDDTKFEEATRQVEVFMEAAYNAGLSAAQDR